MHLCRINLRLIIILTMTTGEKIMGMGFKNYYSNLSEKMKTELRDRILAESGMSYPSFYKKLKDDSYTILERRLIISILDE